MLVDMLIFMWLAIRYKYVTKEDTSESDTLEITEKNCEPNGIDNPALKQWYIVLLVFFVFIFVNILYCFIFSVSFTFPIPFKNLLIKHIINLVVYSQSS